MDTTVFTEDDFESEILDSWAERLNALVEEHPEIFFLYKEIYRVAPPSVAVFFDDPPDHVLCLEYRKEQGESSVLVLSFGTVEKKKFLTYDGLKRSMNKLVELVMRDAFGESGWNYREYAPVYEHIVTVLRKKEKDQRTHIAETFDRALGVKKKRR